MTGSSNKFFYLSRNSHLAISKIVACVERNDLQLKDHKKSIWDKSLKLFYKKRKAKIEDLLFDLAYKFQYHEDIFVFMIILLERCMTDGKPEEVKGPITLKYINSENAYLLLIVSAILAEKVLNDEPYYNQSYAFRYSNFFTNAELNQLELIFLKKINWSLSIERDLYDYYAALLKFDPYPDVPIQSMTAADAKEIEDKLHEIESIGDNVDDVFGGEYGSEYSPSPDYHNAPVVARLEPTGSYPIHRVKESFYTPGLFKASSPDTSQQLESMRVGIHPTTRMFGRK